MKKIIIMLLCLFIFVGCSSDKRSNDEYPVINGSNAYDIILSLEDCGFKKVSKDTHDNGMVYTNSYISGEDVFTYQIYTNFAGEINRFNFTVLSNTHLYTDGIDYIFLCSSFPQDDIEHSNVIQWISDSFNNADLLPEDGGSDNYIDFGTVSATMTGTDNYRSITFYANNNTEGVTS